MGLANQLTEAIERAPLEEWKKTPDGYEMETTKGLAKIFYKKGKRGGKKWFMSLDGKEYAFGRRASFDHAEGVLVKVGARPK